MKVVVTQERRYDFHGREWVLWGTVSVEFCCDIMDWAWDIHFAGFGLIDSNGCISIEAGASLSEVIDRLYLARGDWARDGDGYIDDMSEEWPLRFCPWCGEAIELQEATQNYSAAEHQDGTDKG